MEHLEKFEIFIERSGEKRYDCIISRKFFRLVKIETASEICLELETLLPKLLKKYAELIDEFFEIYL